MIAAILASVIAASPAYDASSWDLSPGSIPRINATGDTPAGIPVVVGGGIVTDPAQVSGTITNLAKYSSDFSNAVWAKQGTTAVGTASVTCPDGVSRTTAQVTLGPSGYRAMYQRIAGQTGGAAYRFSAWIWTNIGSKSFRLGRNNTASWAPGTVSATLTATTTPQRFSLAYTTGVAETQSDHSLLSEGKTPFDADPGIYYICEAQVEVVGDLSTPGPYVATTDSSASGVRGEYDGQPSDPGILVPLHLADPRTWGVGLSASKASWAGADALVDLGGQLSGWRWNSARLETTAGGALVLTVIDSAGASATVTVAAHGFADGSTHKLAFGALDGVPRLIVDGVEAGTLSGAAVLSSFPSTIGINSTALPVVKTVYRVSQGPTPWAASVRLR